MKNKFYYGVSYIVFATLFLFFSVLVCTFLIVLYVMGDYVPFGVLIGAIIFLVFALSLSIITFSDSRIIIVNLDGVQSSLLGRFKKRSLLWADAKDIRVIRDVSESRRGGILIYRYLCYYVFFSESSLDGIILKQAIKRRDNIYLRYSQELFEAIKYYGNIYIEEITEDKQEKESEVINLPKNS